MPDLRPSVTSPRGADRPDGGDEIVDPVIEVDHLDLWYGRKHALGDVSLSFARKQVTALIGPSGCGKSTLLRCINRMNDLIQGVRVQGAIRVDGANIYDRSIDPVEVRRTIGMVFQKPNPFPKSIFDNVAYGPRINRMGGDLHEIVEEALTKAALWDEVKDKLKKSAFALSGGQQQRLCIARAIAVSPDIILMDEPCSALDPIATARIEDLMRELKSEYTIVIVTHNMQQAARVSGRTAFFTVDVDEATGQRTGTVVEYDETEVIFTNPKEKRTEDYVTGRFG